MNESRLPVKLSGKRFIPIWSGNRLSMMYDRFNNAGTVGESWETSTVKDNEAIVLCGNSTIPFSEYLNSIGATPPPLVKLLDTSAPLSIQVHPDEETASKLGGISKSEIWYVLDAASNANILYGTVSGITDEDVSRAIINGNIQKLMNRIPVKAGDVFMIPPGMIHSLGAGITVLEVQDRAGTTYRVKDIAGNRETHIRESIESIYLYSVKEAGSLTHTDTVRIKNSYLPGDMLASTKGYAVSRYEAKSTSVTLFLHYKGVYMFCECGRGISKNVEFTKGDSLYFPDGETFIELDSGSTVLFVI